MKIKSFIIVILFIFSGFIYSQDVSGIPGAFVDIGFGAKPVGLGGAFVGLADDVNAVLWNPAGLYNQKSMQAAFTYTNQLGIIDYHYLAASSEIMGETVGFAMITSGDKALREWTFQAAYARKVYFLSVGAAVKFRYASFGNNGLSESDYVLFTQTEIQTGFLNQVKGSAIGFGLDVGLLYELNNNIKFGLTVRDLLSTLSWNSETGHDENQAKGSYTENIPTELVVGTSFKLFEDLLVVSDYSPKLYSDVSNKLRFGVQYEIYNLVMLRGGYQYFANSVSDEKLVLGIGLNLRSITDYGVFIDYAYMVEDIANSQRFSLGISL